MQQPLKDILSLAESNARWLDDAAQHFEQFASRLHEVEKAQWELLASVYRERAQTVQSEAEKVRASLASDDFPEPRTEDA